MLTRLRSRLRHPFEEKNATDGFTLIEVVVAMFVFMIVSLGILSSVMLTKAVSADAQARQTASNLATAALNVARTTKNLNDLSSSTTTRTLAGRTYTVKTTVKWAPSTTGVTTQCSTGTGAVLGKSVEVAVSWKGASAVSKKVDVTTLVASTSAVTQVGNGSIMVQVTNAQGLPFSAGVALAIAPVPSTGAQTPDSSTIPAQVDAQGCAFIPNLVPGSYTITIGTVYNGMGFPDVDSSGNAQSSRTVGVTANTTQPATFTYDQSTPVTATLGPTGATLPVGVQTTFVHDDTISMPPGGCNGVAAQHCVFPYSNGYSLIAGNLGTGTAPGCESVDPTKWLADANYQQGAAAPVVTTAGTAVTANAPMGTVAISGLAAITPASPATLTISAKQQASSATDAADPGCVIADGNSYTFPPIAGDTATLALPYGTWALTYSTSVTYTLKCTATRTYSGGSYVYKCSNTGTSTPSGHTPPASGSTCPTGSGSGSGGSYSCTWTDPSTSSATPLSSQIVTPTAPSSVAGNVVTLDPRRPVSSP
ncbi:hypothetical protein GCM10022286_16350 [Gryllotalpicola daejeonensis]|uniref:Prepilin-type N-terminal cleavage/methylation domain-containing protein n=1 Tax=Gryllotalpicola daejeonensis TaxID=993087 RepID=A0ABP7ZJM7_9MICO